MVAWMSSGRAAKLRLLASIQKPSHMWLVKETYFCTSYSLAIWISDSGFSCPSAIFVCKAE